MGFKIRDKSLFWTKSGWKNNWEPRILNMPRASHPTETAYLNSRYDHHSFLRMVQSYRNYSRILRQYLHGDSKTFQVIQMELRTAFHIPFTCETPVELIKHGAERRMADQLDRDYQLMTYNFHPFQLYAYKMRNQYIRQQNQQFEKVSRGEITATQILQDALEAQLAAESKRLGPGERISLEKVTEIFTRLSRQLDEHTGESQNPRGHDGQFMDYAERRRPFVEADQTKHSH